MSNVKLEVGDEKELLFVQCELIAKKCLDYLLQVVPNPYIDKDIPNCQNCSWFLWKTFHPKNAICRLQKWKELNGV